MPRLIIRVGVVLGLVVYSIYGVGVGVGGRVGLGLGVGVGVGVP